MIPQHTMGAYSSRVVFLFLLCIAYEHGQGLSVTHRCICQHDGRVPKCLGRALFTGLAFWGLRLRFQMNDEVAHLLGK
jgi:hypothetical protein